VDANRGYPPESSILSLEFFSVNSEKLKIKVKEHIMETDISDIRNLNNMFV